MCLTIFLYFFPYVLHQKFITSHKRVMHDTNLMAFQTDLRNVNSNSINHSPETNSKYKTFFKIFSELYEIHFPLKDFQIKVKNLHGPWISKGLKKLKINRFKMNKSSRTINIFLKNWFKKLSKHTISLYLRIVKMTWHAHGK